MEEDKLKENGDIESPLTETPNTTNTTTDTEIDSIDIVDSIELTESEETKNTSADNNVKSVADNVIENFKDVQPVSVSNNIDDIYKQADNIKVETTSENVTCKENPFSPIKKDDKGVSYSLPPANYDKLTEILIALEKVISGTNFTADDIPYHSEIQKCRIATSPVKHYEDALKEEGSHYYQSSQVEDNKYTTDGIKFYKGKYKEGNDKELTGSKAKLLLASLIKGASLVRIPLIHSGFWVNIIPPTESDLLDLYNKLALSKKDLGRRMGDLVYSNANIAFIEILTDFILSNIEKNPIQGIDIKDLPNYIHINDMNILIWGMAYAIYPNGFKYSRMAIGQLGEEMRMVEGILDLSKLLWFNSANIPTELSQKLNSRIRIQISRDVANDYRKEVNELMNKKVGMTLSLDEIKLNFKSPTLADHILDGNIWVSDLTDTVNAAIANASSDAEQNQIINDYISTNYLGRISHFIDGFELPRGSYYSSEVKPIDKFGKTRTEDEMVVERNKIRSDITDMLSIMSGDREYIHAIQDKVKEIESKSLLALIAAPTVTQEEEKVMVEHPNLFPIDPLICFFILLGLKMIEIKQKTANIS